MTSADKILQRALVGSGLDTDGWSKIQASLRDRAFFSSQITQSKILYAMRHNVSELLKGGKSESEIRRDLRQYLHDIGNPQCDGSIKDLYSRKRLDVMIKTNADQARGYMTHLRATTPGAIMAFPAYELVRVEDRKLKRDWSVRWRNAAESVGWDGVSRGPRMVALKTSPVWAAISRFGNPFPPFDFNSGMGVRDVSKSVCREIGLLDSEEQPKIPDAPDFNRNLYDSVPFDNRSPEYSRLREMFGDQIQFNHDRGVVQWRSELFSDEFDTKGQFAIRLGRLPNGHILPELEKAVGDNSLTMTRQNWLDVKRKDGSDHRTHFFNDPKNPENIPLKPGDIDMLPSIWRNPDKARKIQKDLYELRVGAVDGGDFVLHVKVNNGIPSPWSFFRSEKGVAGGARMSPRAERRS